MVLQAYVIEFQDKKYQSFLGPGEDETVHRSISPVTTRFVRMIPLTDRKMPVCIRTELYGCYLDHPAASSDPFIEDYINFGIIVSGAVLMIFISFVAALCLRKRSPRRRHSSLGEQSSLRYSRQDQFLVRNQFTMRSNPSYSNYSQWNYQPEQKWQNHEYTEIGSPDSGKGDSLK